MNISEKYRLSHVDRWNIVATTRRQSVAEHSWLVAMIACEICERMGRGDIIDQVRKYAVEHDLTEVYTGDVNTLFKSEIATEFPTAVKNAERRLFPTMKFSEDLPADVAKIVKAADLVEAMVYVLNYSHPFNYVAGVHDSLEAAMINIPSDIREVAFKIKEEILAL